MGAVMDTVAATTADTAANTATDAARRAVHRTPTGIRGRVAAMLRQGLDIAACARILGMPVDFVRQIAESLEAEGAIDLVTWRGSHGCATGGCDPDPDSPLCAGCPLKPVQLRRKRRAKA